MLEIRDYKILEADDQFALENEVRKYIGGRVDCSRWNLRRSLYLVR
jgi:hypothetical protein